MKKGAIFDMDGTLFDTESAYKKGWVATAEFYGKDRGVELSQKVSGSGIEICKKYTREFYPDLDADEFLKRVVDTAMKIIEVDFKVMAGVNEILQFFKDNGVKMAVASSSTAEVVKRNLTRANIKEYFDAVIDTDQVVNGKPAPDIFLKAAAAINLAPSDCYVFEDAYNGIRGAAAAGCAPVMIPDTNQPTDEMRQLCVGIYSNLNDAVAAIKRGEI